MNFWICKWKCSNHYITKFLKIWETKILYILEFSDSINDFFLTLTIEFRIKIFVCKFYNSWIGHNKKIWCKIVGGRAWFALLPDWRFGNSKSIFSKYFVAESDLFNSFQHANIRYLIWFSTEVYLNMIWKMMKFIEEILGIDRKLPIYF